MKEIIINILDKIVEIIKLFSPKYYDRITKYLLIPGVGLLAKPIWLEIVNIFLKEFNFSIIGEKDWIIGLIIIVLALIYNTIQSYLHLKYSSESKPAFQNISNKTFSSFGNLCQEILPLLKDNEYIFKSTGPNSNSETAEPLRTDLTMWNKLKVEVIIPNNEAIKKLIEENRSLIPAKQTDLFDKMILHIRAFNEHIVNPNFDYKPYQFPNKFPEIVIKNSFNTAKENKDLKRKVKWISKKLNTKYVSDWIIFGSIVVTPEKANDVDIAILLSNSVELKTGNERLSQIKFDFKVKFKRDLHLSVFEYNKLSDFKKFSKNNPQKIEKKNG